MAEEFAVDLPEVEEEKQLTRAVIIAALVQDGVTWDMYKEAFPDVEDIPDEPATEPNSDDTAAAAAREIFKEPTVLLKMDRMNPHLEIRGYTFSRLHPFVPVREADAEYILQHEEGFKIAMPSEAEEFYK